MTSNVEIKAVLSNVGEAHKVSSELSNSKGVILNQVDTFYNSSNGRLKMRSIKQVLTILLDICSYY